MSDRIYYATMEGDNYRISRYDGKAAFFPVRSRMGRREAVEMMEKLIEAAAEDADGEPFTVSLTAWLT